MSFALMAMSPSNSHPNNDVFSNQDLLIHIMRFFDINMLGRWNATLRFCLTSTSGCQSLWKSLYGIFLTTQDERPIHLHQMGAVIEVGQYNKGRH